MTDFSWLDMILVIAGWELGKYVYGKLFHRPLYRNKKEGITVWMKGDKAEREQLRDSYLADYGEEN